MNHFEGMYSVIAKRLTIRTSHNRFELSFELLNRYVPLEFISTDVTSPKCEEIVLMQRPETMSQNFIVLSLELQVCLLVWKCPKKHGNSHTRL